MLESQPRQGASQLEDQFPNIFGYELTALAPTGKFGYCPKESQSNTQLDILNNYAIIRMRRSSELRQHSQLSLAPRPCLRSSR